MTQRSRVQFLEDMASRLPTNDRGLITAAQLRNSLTDLADSTVFKDEHVDTGTGTASPRLSVLTLTASTALTTADHINKLLIFDSTADLSFSLPNDSQVGDWIKVRRANTGNVSWELVPGALIEVPASKNSHTRLGERFSTVDITCVRNDGGSAAVWTIEGPTQDASPTQEDVDPDQFVFTDVPGAEIDTPYTSNIITVTGIGAPATIAVSGDASAAYSINGGPFVSSDGTVNNGDVVRVRVTSSSDYTDDVSAVLTIGSVSDTYTVTTKAEPVADTTPDAFAFTPVSGATTSTDYISNTITVSGINAGAAISITGGVYSRNSGAFTSNAGTVFNGDTIRVRVTSSSVGNTATTAQLTIGGVVGSYTVTTAVPADTTPDAFAGPWTQQNDVQANTVYTSSPSTITGITGAAPISIVGGSYSINNGSYTSANGTVNNNDVVRVRVTSAPTGNTTTTATVTIGGVTGSFSVRTAVGAGSGTGIQIDEGRWKLIAPVDSGGATVNAAKEFWPPELLSLDQEGYFDRQSDGSIIFIAPTDGARVSGSNFARSELRQILPDASNDYNWDIDTGGKFEASCAVLELPTLTAGSQNRVAIAQVHSTSEEVCRVYYWAGGRLSLSNAKGITTTLTVAEVETNLTTTSGTQTSIPLGAFFDMTVEVDRDETKVTVVYNGTTYVARQFHSSYFNAGTLPTLHFRVGAYNQVGAASGVATNRGTGRSRVHFKRIINPVHPLAVASASTLPSGYIRPSQINPVTYSRSTPFAFGYFNNGPSGYGRFRPTISRKSYAFSSPDDNEIRIEVRSGDLYSEPDWTDPSTSERSEVQFWTAIPIANTVYYEWESRLEGPTNTAPWCTLHQSFALGAGGSPPCGIYLESGDNLRIITRTDASGSTVESYRYSLNGIARNTWHKFRVELKMGRSNNASLRVVLNGSQVVNLTGINIGYSGQTGIDPYWGIYRRESPETLVHRFRNLRVWT